MKPCRDCGYELTTNARGCPGCARNVEAEEMIDRFIWRRLVPLLIIMLIVGAAIFVWRR
ncbi:MAG TPA: hypothetical protein VJ306_11565 [Pyrinomonadaceae bacterium]|nr:hypothetical protein [Pyrinomonadaceae bacterium]